MKKIKIGTIGNTLVGKTAISRNYLGEEFSPEEMLTVGMDRFVKEEDYIIREKKVRINISIYDTSGQERYEAIVFNFIKKCDGVLLVYSITDEQTFNDLNKWIEKIRELQPDKKYPVVLVGNKIDLEEQRVISKEKGEKIAKENLFPFYETSAKTGEKVNESFQHLIDLILEYKEEELVNGNTKKNIKLEVDENNVKKNKEKDNKTKDDIEKKNCCCCKKNPENKKKSKKKSNKDNLENNPYETDFEQSLLPEETTTAQL